MNQEYPRPSPPWSWKYAVIDFKKYKSATTEVDAKVSLRYSSNVDEIVVIKTQFAHYRIMKPVTIKFKICLGFSDLASRNQHMRI